MLLPVPIFRITYHLLLAYELHAACSPQGWSTLLRWNNLSLCNLKLQQLFLILPSQPFFSPLPFGRHCCWNPWNFRKPQSYKKKKKIEKDNLYFAGPSISVCHPLKTIITRKLQGSIERNELSKCGSHTLHISLVVCSEKTRCLLSLQQTAWRSGFTMLQIFHLSICIFKLCPCGKRFFFLSPCLINFI